MALSFQEKIRPVQTGGQQSLSFQAKIKPTEPKPTVSPFVQQPREKGIIEKTAERAFPLAKPFIGAAKVGFGAIKSAFTGLPEIAEERGEKIKEIGIEKFDKQTLPSSILQTTGQFTGAVSDVFGEAIMGGIRALPEDIKNTIKDTGVKIAETEKGKEVLISLQNISGGFKALEEERPELAGNLRAVASITEFVLDLLGVGAVKKGVKIAGEVAEETLETGAKLGREFIEETAEKIPFFKKASKELEEAIITKTEIPRQTRKEITAGISPDIKKRISGKGEELNRFFEQARKRNIDDTALSPLALGAEDTKKAFNILENQINDVGSDIGKFRQKISTFKASPDDVQVVINKFDDVIKRKGLISGKDRKIITAGGRESIVSVAELKLLQEMRDMLVRLKGDPQLIRILDNRNIIQKKINFAKESREISNELDGVSRSVRAEIAKMNEKLVGKLEAKNIEEFSNLMDALNEFKALTSKGKNTEFLLKRILSERDRLPKEVIEKIKEITGIDLMDTATFSRLATDILGNSAQKGLFRQEIANAGIDVIDIFAKGKLGAVKFLKDLAISGVDEIDLLRGIDPKLKKAESIADMFIKSSQKK